MKNGIKVNIFVLLMLLIFMVNINETIQYKIKGQTKTHTLSRTQAKLKAMFQFKSKTNTIFNNLLQATFEVNPENKVQTHEEVSKTKINGNKSTKKRFYRVSKESFRKISSVPINKEIIYPQYKYKTYTEIVNQLLEFKKNYPNLVKISIAQERYNLPYPGGKCDNGNYSSQYGNKCPHYIVEISNFNISDESKHQIYISGAVHGNERVGPNATVELINLLTSEFNKDKWITYLLNNRLIVITPMTNPHGYQDNVREELLIDDEDSWNLTSNRYSKTHKDINRDFPYLVKNDECFESIGGRVVNELFLEHIFTLSLSLHGGTESFTYPYGTPNHIVGNPHIKMDYEETSEGIINSKLGSQFNEELIDEYLDGHYDKMNDGNQLVSTPSPDFNSIKQVVTTTNNFTNNNTDMYRTGDMSSVVYPVRGGMEDWAYAASWEGNPVITSPCEPNTYGGYSSEKTKYDNYPFALKSIMFLLEISYDKFPETSLLGRSNNDCILHLRDNAFKENKSNLESKDLCYESKINGYIPKILRLSLSLIDILYPYIISSYSISKDNKEVEISYRVGGAIEVNESDIYYSYLTENQLSDLYDKEKKQFKDKDFNLFKSDTSDLKIIKNNMRLNNSKGVWHLKYNNENDTVKFKVAINSNAYLIYQVKAKADQSWKEKISNDLNISPTSNLVNLRTSNFYIAKNKRFKLKGSDTIYSDLILIRLNNASE